MIAQEFSFYAAGSYQIEKCSGNVAENERLHKKLVIAPIFLLKLEMIHNESNERKHNGMQVS